MPWEKKFDEQKVLNKAMKAFWQNGYDGTSMKQLIGCMGLNPGSIYATFGDKHALFCRAMEIYVDQIREKHRELKANNSPRAVLIAVFDEMVTTIEAADNHDGCFMVNTALDIAPQDKEIQNFICRWFKEIELFFRETIAEAQKLGEVDKDLDAAKTARHIMTLMCGAQVLARVNSKHQVIKDFKDQIEELLN